MYLYNSYGQLTDIEKIEKLSDKDIPEIVKDFAKKQGLLSIRKTSNCIYLYKTITIMDKDIEGNDLAPERYIEGFALTYNFDGVFNDVKYFYDKADDNKLPSLYSVNDLVKKEWNFDYDEFKKAVCGNKKTDPYAFNRNLYILMEKESATNCPKNIVWKAFNEIKKLPVTSNVMYKNNYINCTVHSNNNCLKCVILVTKHGDLYLNGFHIGNCNRPINIANITTSVQYFNDMEYGEDDKFFDFCTKGTELSGDDIQNDYDVER